MEAAPRPRPPTPHLEHSRGSASRALAELVSQPRDAGARHLRRATKKVIHTLRCHPSEMSGPRKPPPHHEPTHRVPEPGHEPVSHHRGTGWKRAPAPGNLVRDPRGRGRRRVGDRRPDRSGGHPSRHRRADPTGQPGDGRGAASHPHRDGDQLHELRAAGHGAGRDAGHRCHGEQRADRRGAAAAGALGAQAAAHVRHRPRRRAVEHRQRDRLRAAGTAGGHHLSGCRPAPDRRARGRLCGRVRPL